MEIEWRAPFELAFELGLFLIGSILVVFVVCVALIILFGLIRAFFTALRSARSGKARGKLRAKKSAES